MAKKKRAAKIRRSLTRNRARERELAKIKQQVLIKVQKEGFALENVNESFKKDKEIVLAAVKNIGLALKYADKSLQNDKEIVLAAVRDFGSALKFADKSLQKDKKFVLTAVQKNPSIFTYINKSFQKNPDFLEYKNYKRIEYSKGDFYLTKSKKNQRHGKGKYFFANGSEYIGIWKNGELHNVMGKIVRKGTYDYPEIFIYKWEDGEILYICNEYNSYEYFIRSQRQLNHLIKNWFLKTKDIINLDGIIYDELSWKKLHYIQFLESSMPAIFNVNFHKIATIGTLPFHIEFMGFKPTPQHNKYFLKLMKNNRGYADDKRDFAHMSNLYFNNVKLTSQKAIVLASEFFKTFLSDIYSGGTVYNVSETAYDLHSRNTWLDPKYKGPKPKPRKGFDPTNIKQRKEVEKFYLPNGDGEFTLKINGKLAFDSIGFSKNFDYNKLYEIYELEDQKKFKREIKNYFNNFFKKLNFTKYFKAKKVNTISFVVESMDEDFRSSGFDVGDDWDINKEWEKINSL